MTGVELRLGPCDLFPESPFCKSTELSHSLFLILDPADRDPDPGGGGDRLPLGLNEKY